MSLVALEKLGMKLGDGRALSAEEWSWLRDVFGRLATVHVSRVVDRREIELYNDRGRAGWLIDETLRLARREVAETAGQAATLEERVSTLGQHMDLRLTILQGGLPPLPRKS